MGNRTRECTARPRWGVALLLLVPLLIPSAWAGHKGEAQEEGHKGPKLLLTASPLFGFPPLTVHLAATLTGVDPHDANFCHARVIWTRIDPGTSQDMGSKMTESPRCLHDPKEVYVATTYSKTFEMYTPGDYLYRLTLEGKDGTQVISKLVKVQVMRIP